MKIRSINAEDLKGEFVNSLVDLFKRFFPVHNQFQKDDVDIIDYLKKEAKFNELIVLEDNGVKAAMFIVNTGKDKDKTHMIWKFRHFAFENESGAAKLLKEVENRIKSFSKTAKIELTIAESEKGVDFYKNHDYDEEAALKNHYRWGETCFILSKSLS